MYLCLIFFFFQAEDGIRDSSVTGVQTCALPILRFWSSNIPHGYGEKEVPRSKIANAIFSRLETPANLTRIHDVPVVDVYLASLLRKKSNFAEASQKCGI